MKRTLTIGLALLFAAQLTQAQDRWSLEIGGGALAPTQDLTQDLGDADLSTGLGLEAVVTYRFLPHLSGYAGWGWHHFTADELFAGLAEVAEVDVEETGYTFGLRFAHPVRALPLEYFLQAGGIVDHIELENDEGDLVADSEHGLGWQVGGGLVLPLSDHWRLLPGVRYRSLSRDIEVDGVETDVEADLTYVTVRLGLSRTF